VPFLEGSIGPQVGKQAMPRGSKPGERRGGRQRGTPNKKTALRHAATAAAASNPDISPLDFLLAVMKDPNESPELRIKVAQAAAPFIHAKPGTARWKEPAASAKPIDGTCNFIIDPVLARGVRDDCERLDELGRKRELNSSEQLEKSWLRQRITTMATAIGCPFGYGPVQEMQDMNRLHDLRCKRIAPRGALLDHEDAEEAQLRARLEAYLQSPEGLARSRIRELEWKLPNYRTSAEQSELDALQALYPDPPPTPTTRSPVEGWQQAYLKRKADRS
jgi:hypothetical protein